MNKLDELSKALDCPRATPFFTLCSLGRQNFAFSERAHIFFGSKGGGGGGGRGCLAAETACNTV